MKKILLILITVSFICYCGKTGDPPQEKEKKTDVSEIKKEEATETDTTLETDVNTISSLVIKEVKFVSAPNETTDQVVNITLAKPDADVFLDYRWFVNKNEITDIKQSVLPKEYFKENDWVQCWVTAEKGDLSSSIVKTKFLKISGALPVLRHNPVDEFSVPGNFYYKIELTNVDVENKDDKTLTFELLSPKKEGINLDSKTGEINWFIDDSAVKKLGNSIEIKFKVIKTNAGEVTSSITLKLKKPAIQESE